MCLVDCIVFFFVKQNPAYRMRISDWSADVFSSDLKDALAVTGKGRIRKSYPKVPGIEFAGHGESSSDKRYRPGDAVLVTGCNIGEVFDGGYAEFARVAADSIIRKPDGLSLRETMAIGTAGFTAAFALRRMLENHQAPEMGPIAIRSEERRVGKEGVSRGKSRRRP